MTARYFVGVAIYYHGGVTDLTPGDLVLPPDETDSESLHEDTTEQYGEDRNPHRSDRVYLTTSIEWARFYALAHATRGRPPPMIGAVYRVAPDDTLEVDHDQPESFDCARATVREVLDAEIPVTQENVDWAHEFLARRMA